MPSSSTNQSAQQRVREQYTQGITSPTGLAQAGVVGTPSRCCPAAKEPAAVVFACGFRCCFAVIAKKKKKKLAITLMLLLKLLEKDTAAVAKTSDS